MPGCFTGSALLSVFRYIETIYHADTFRDNPSGRPRRLWGPAWREYHPRMAFTGRSFDPTRTPPPPAGPTVDYRLARRAALASVRQGSLDTADICDAHPELMRAAKNIGEKCDPVCPVCSHDSLRLVRYVYGPELKRDNGRVVYPEEWLTELATRHDQFTC